MNANATRLNTREAASSTHAHRRSVRREREFGTGYGRTSGYADGLRRYAGRDAGANFRVHGHGVSGPAATPAGQPPCSAAMSLSSSSTSGPRGP